MPSHEDPAGRQCDFCGPEADDSDLTHCHNCGATICVDNCVKATNEEHGLDFCWACTKEAPADDEVAWTAIGVGGEPREEQ